MFSSQTSSVKTSTSDIFSQVSSELRQHSISGMLLPIPTSLNVLGLVILLHNNPALITGATRPFWDITADTLTSSEANYIKGKNGSTYRSQYWWQGMLLSAESQVGKWIDVIVFCFWLSSYPRGVWFQQINSKKIELHQQRALLLLKVRFAASWLKVFRLVVFGR